jgi:hypothetical protein
MSSIDVMCVSQWRWKRLHRTGPDHHKIFVDENSGRLSVADCSGNLPHHTDDGVLWIRDDVEYLQVTGSGSFGRLNVRLRVIAERRGGECSVWTDVGAGLFVSEYLKIPLVLTTDYGNFNLEKRT